MFLAKFFSVKLIHSFENRGHNFNRLAEMNNITIANKLDMSYDFSIRLNMHALEWKLNALINKSKSFINKLNRKCRNLLIRKFEDVPTSDEY